MGRLGTFVGLALILTLAAPQAARAAEARVEAPSAGFAVNVAGLVHLGADCFEAPDSMDARHCDAADFDFPQIALGLGFHFQMADRHGHRHWFRKSDVVIKGGDPKVPPPKKPEAGGSASRS